MYLTELECLNFRNFPKLNVRFKPGCTVLLGKNGQGKTSVVEAIALLSQGRSFRTSDDNELIGRKQPAFTMPVQELEALGLPQAPFAKVLGHVVLNQQADEQETLELRWQGEAKPLPATETFEEEEPQEPSTAWKYKLQVRRNEKPLRSRTHLLGVFSTVSFVLSDLLLLRGTPGDRRRWLDLMVAQWQPGYAQTLLAYNRVVKQKAQWLKQQIKGQAASTATWGQEALLGGAYAGGFETVLHTLNAQQAALAVPVWQARWQGLLALRPWVKQVYAGLCGGQDAPVWMGYSLVGQLGVQLGQELEPLVALPPEQLEAIFLHHLQRVSMAERAKGQCLLGPHREDVLLALGTPDWSAYRFASQGQQRSLVLALKLAELEVLLAKQGEAPVLLLDDVMAELDTSRQQVLLEQLGRVQQVFLTTTHLEQPVLYPLLQGHGQHPVQVFQVEHACLQGV